MARITTVTKSMKDQTCGRCGKDLPKGSAYQWAKPGFRSRTRLIRCLGCAFRQSELTTSLKGIAYAAQEAGEDALAEWDSEDVGVLEAIRDAVVEGATECLEAYQEAQDAWTENGAWENSEWDEYISELESWVDELEGLDFEEYVDDDPEDEGEARQEWADEQRSSLEEAIGALGL